MNIKFFRHVGDSCPAGLRFDDIVSAYLADGRWWVGSATALDWTSGAADSPLCWARGIISKPWAAPMVADALVALTNAPEPVAARPDADGWIEWRGGECPVHRFASVEVRLRNGAASAPVLATCLTWFHRLPPESFCDIIAYRVVSEPSKPSTSPVDPYAEAKAAWKDGEMEVMLGGKWTKMPDGLTPTWTLPPGSYRRRPKADAPTTNEALNAARFCVAQAQVDKEELDKLIADMKEAKRQLEAPILVAGPAPKPTALWYLSGPMSGLPDLNFPAFHAAAAKLRALGMAIVNPAEQTAVPAGSAWADYMRHDIGIMMACKGIIMLPGWQNSEGAKLEHHIAEALGMTVLAFEHLPR